MQRADTLYREHLANLALRDSAELPSQCSFQLPLAVDLTRRLRVKTRPPQQGASTSQDIALAPTDGEMHDSQRQAHPDDLQLDADDFGLTEADFAAIGVAAELPEDQDLADDEDPFNWGSWA